MRPAGRKRTPTARAVDVPCDGWCDGPWAAGGDPEEGRPEDGCADMRCSLHVELVGEQNGLGDLAHRLAGVHAELLDAAEGFLLAELMLLHQDALGPLDLL